MHHHDRRCGGLVLNVEGTGRRTQACIGFNGINSCIVMANASMTTVSSARS